MPVPKGYRRSTPRKIQSVESRLTQRRIIDSRGCWNWHGRKNTNGYGIICMRSLGVRSPNRLVHRVSMSTWRGFDLNSTLKILHRCDNPACFNPDHLFIGTQQDNLLDCQMKGRRRGPRGTTNHKAKLSNSDIAAIRHLADSGFGPRIIQKQLALPVTEQQVGNIIMGKKWRHLE